MSVENKSLSESVYARLKNLALAKNRPTQEVLRYYAMERFLYRLSVSPHKSSFFLKGGLMLMVWDPATHRATIDIDLLANSNNSIENISRILREICSQTVLQDGIEFNSTDLILAESQVATEYTGLSARFSAYLHTAKLPLRLDIGFSDKIFPKPATVKEVPKAFSEAFYNAPKTLERWDSFLKGVGHEPISLKKVVFEIRDFFLPILTEHNA